MYIKSIQINNKNQIEKYVSELDSINSIKELTFHKPITFFVGENGTGKSTLLETITISWGFNPEEESKNFIFSTGNSHSNFPEMTLLPLKQLSVLLPNSPIN